MTDPKKPKAELVDLTIEEGSPVDDGDNPPAKIALVKNKPTTEDTVSDKENKDGKEGVFARMKRWATDVTAKMYGQPRTTGQIIAADAFRDQFWKARMALVESMNSILECAAPDQIGPLMAQSVGEFTGIINTLSANMSAEKRAEVMALVSTMTDALADKTAIKRNELVGAVEKLEDFTFTPVSSAQEAPAETTKEQDMSDKNKPGAITMEVVLAKMSPEEKALLEAAIAAKAAPVTQEDPALKGASPEILKRLDSMAKDLEALRAKEDASSITSKANAICRDVPGVAKEDVIAALTDAQKSGGAEGLARAERMLSGLSAMAKRGTALTSKIGHSRTIKAGEQPATAEDLVTVKAREMMKTDGKITFEGAYAKVMSESPRLARAAIMGADLNS